MWRTTAFSLLLCCFLALDPASGANKNVNVELRTKWRGTSLLSEMGELLAEEKTELFWKFVDKLLELQPNLSSEECVKEILAQGGSLVDGPLRSILELSLLSRTASPKLVVHRQLAKESLIAHSELETKVSADDRWTIGDNLLPPKGKCCWVDVGSRIFYEEDNVQNWLKEGLSDSKQEVELFDFDHVYPDYESSRTAILYGSLGTPCFRNFHTILSKASKEGLLKYVFRPVLLSGCEAAASSCARVGTGKSLNLPGYGVELALKNMEYKAIDDSELAKSGGSEEHKADDLSQDVGGFIFSKLLERKPHLEGELMTFRDHLLSSDISESMNVWELKDLGYQAAQRIVGASEPLRLMQELNQNFPTLVSSLSRMKINETIMDEIVSNQQMIAPGRNLFAINGALVNTENLDLFSLIHMIHEELTFADKIVKMKVPSSAVQKFLRLPNPSEQTSVRLDYRSDDFVYYLNNLEEDAMYKRWRLNLNELLMPVFPGQLRYVRKNLFHAVHVIDPATVEGLKVVDTIMYYYGNNVPMRFGLILLSSRQVKLIESGKPLAEDDISSLVIRLFLYIKDTQTVRQAFDFLYNLHVASAEDQVDGFVNERHVKEALSDTLKAEALETYLKLTESDDYKEAALKSSEFVINLGLSKTLPTFLMNGLVYGPSQAQHAAITAMNEEMPKIQEGVYFGHINSRTDVLHKFLSEEGFIRYNPKIVAKRDDSKYISLAIPVIEKHPVIERLQYLHSPGTEDDLKPVTHWLLLDLTGNSGKQLLKQAVRFLMQGSSISRLAVLHNANRTSDVKETSSGLLLMRIFNHVVHSSSRRAKNLRFLQEFLAMYESKDYTFEETIDLFVKLADDAGLNVENLKTVFLESSSFQTLLSQLDQERNFVTGLFGVSPGSNAVVTNGRLFLQEEGELFVAEDFLLLEQVEYKRRIKDIQMIVEDIEWEGLEPDDVTSEFLSTVVMLVSSMMSSRARSSETVNFELLKAEHSAIVRDVEGAPLQIDAVINPLSSVGQKLAPLLLLLEEWLHPSMRIVLNPMNSLADVPLKNFYRYVVPSKEGFSADGFGPSARFSNMPPSRTLTMNLDVPETWLVEPVVAVHDLDNIVLDKLGSERTLHAVYELEALMVTGHCYEGTEPPRGLQLILGTKHQPHMVDTIVMANLGYFQLKAAPGVWSLRLADGRSKELYTLKGPKEGTDEGPISRRVVVADMRGELVNLDVVRRKGKENEKLLDAHSEVSKSKQGKQTKGFLKWATDLIVGGAKSPIANNSSTMVVREGETINIFSVASGHLYERFLKIMMLTVLKNTRRPVKFWFIKNYLSPQFKDVIPHMAHEYGFEYELITYKWPTWLHKQTEKQRIIWAYKILFLDVIFPLSLKKVIYVDADQIVRTDMGELYDMDIRGRPLAYTPFCDNNREMDGYRFWSQGFWREHLQGRPYHISALYVVDLIKFRQTAAGDNLRVFYENLSKDPNSLSNLDQDLPNYAQHTVPIFSLPQEWLWCESWCGNSTKAKAKTIDLCNNPMTKEPKLEGARRIVKEWPVLDDEVREFTKKILGNDDAAAATTATETETETKTETETATATVTSPDQPVDEMNNSDLKDEL